MAATTYLFSCSPSIRSCLSIQTLPPATTVTPSRSSPPHLISNLPIRQPDSLRRLLRLAGEQRDLALGQALHAVITKAHHQHDHTRLLNSLITTYLKLGELSDALQVIDEMPFPDVASFTSIISYYAKSGMENEVVSLFARMRQMDVNPNEFSFVALVTNCIRQFNFQLGSQVHAFALKTYYSNCTHVSNALIGMYVRCGHVDSALQVFGEMPERDVSSWNAAILGMVEECRYAEAFELFDAMGADGTYGDRFSLSTLLTAAVESFTGGEGEAIHAYALKIGLDFDLSVGNALLALYTKFGRMEDLLHIFDRMHARDVISWTAVLNGFMEFGLVESAIDFFNKMPEKNHISYNVVLAGFCKNGHGSEGLDFFQQILVNEVEISDFTITSLVKACTLASDMKKTEQIHGFIIKSGCKPSAWIDSALVNLFAKCGRMEDALKIFEQQSDEKEKTSCITWTSLIHAYGRNGQPDEALTLFCRMIKRENFLNIDELALAAILGVCGTLGFFNFGKQIKSISIKLGFLCELGVSNAIISLFAKCGYLKDAVLFFNQMPEHDIISWNTLINAFLLFRLGDEALSMWNEMENCAMFPDSISYVLIISACKYTSSRSISIQNCERLFSSMSMYHNIRAGPEHYAAMVDVLSFWGSFDKAERLIESMPFKCDAYIWRSLLEGCRLKSDHKRGRRVVERILALEPQDPFTYILMSNLYSASGRWHCSEKLREEMRSKGLRKNPARSWVTGRNGLHSFFCRDKSHQQYKDIYGALDILILECMKAGYEPDTSYVLHEVEEYQKRDFLFYHSAKLAVTYGIIMSQSQTVRVVKNVRLCGDCHLFLKFASFVTCREILLRDSTGFHIFKEGKCSCGDRW
ncbi:hypothetical protein KFK09_001997 [Dendrobium nobile]|uniref:DYW domain-containing protein n=1 Tax=Dendrobium nobile TaxID=94219 RepID=A0A8T3C915_DENNO|nr:hypothetical protein KFK09_001997 [Dendrobium nobile]